MKSQVKPWWSGDLFRGTFVILFLLILSVFIGYHAKNNIINDRQGLLEDLGEQIITPWRQNNLVEVEKVLVDFAKNKDVLYLNLSDKNTGYFTEYRHEEYDDQELTNSNQFVQYDNNQNRTSWAVRDGGTYIGSLEVVWRQNSFNDKPHYLVWVLLLLIGISVILFWRSRFMKDIGKTSKHHLVDIQSSEIFENVAQGLNFNIRIHEVVRAKDPANVVYGYVSLEWFNGKTLKESLSFGALSDLLFNNSLVVPIFPWLLRNLFLQKRKMMVQGASYPLAFELCCRQFVDDDFRFFLFKLCKSMQIPMSSILIEVKEGCLASMDQSALDVTLKQWRAAGVEVIVSNFGSTNNSELILNKLSIDKIKWDASWLNRQWFCPDSRQRVMALQAMAKQRNISMVLNDGFTSLNHGVLNDVDLDLLQIQPGAHVFKLKQAEAKNNMGIDKIDNFKLS